MTTHSWELLQDYFQRITEADPDDQKRLLNDCQTRYPSLYPELLELLECDEQTNDELDEAFSQAQRIIMPALDRFDLENHDDSPNNGFPEIQDFKILRRLGMGAMGAVFEAEQRSSQRKVAIKILKNINSKESSSRFKNEAHTLAQMKHPNIAQFILSGQSQEGRPYIAMEYVEGSIITHYCDSNHLTLEQRIEIFLQVCNGVLHAHQQGIVHRDLKPANILVTHVDGKPLIKIIDFGIAKITQEANFESAFQTELGYFMGTPAYMSPEQASMELIDTRSDIFALGAVLYELLCGCLIINLNTFYELNSQERIQFILNRKPDRASTATMRCTVKQCELIAENRRTTCPDLARSLKGDLDAILSTSLQKNKDDRYKTVTDLSHDLTAYLRKAPVKAAKATPLYIITKFISRNRLTTALAAIALVAIIYGLITTSVLLSETKQAYLQLEEVKDALEASSNLYTEILISPSPDASGPDTSVLEQLGKSEQIIIGQLENQPKTEQYIRFYLAKCYYGLSQYNDAEHHLVKAFQIPTAFSPKLFIQLLTLLGRTLQKLEKYHEAEIHLQTALEAWQSLPESHDAEYLDTKEALANFYLDQNQPFLALNLYQEILDSAGWKTLKPFEKALKYSGIANTYFSFGDIDRALFYYQQALVIQTEQLDPYHSQTMSTRKNMLRCYQELNCLDDAQTQYAHLFEEQNKKLGKEHPSTLSTLYSMARNRYLNRDFDNAKKELEEGLQQARDFLGKDHNRTLNFQNVLAATELELGNFQQARDLFAETVKAYEGKDQGNTKSAFLARANLVETMIYMEDTDEAVRYAQQTLELAKKTPNLRPSRQLILQASLAQAYEANYEFTKAIDLLKPTIDSAKAQSMKKETIADYQLSLARLYFKREEPDKAKALLDKIEATTEGNSKTGLALKQLRQTYTP